MDQSEFQQLREDFIRHEAICEERWKTVFNEIREAKEEGRERWDEVRSYWAAIHRLIWAGGGALILFLAGLLAMGPMI